MTEKEIMQALRCSATREEREKCEMCRKWMPLPDGPEEGDNHGTTD